MHYMIGNCSFNYMIRLFLCYQMILSFELPFALIPLLKFTSSKTKMGIHANTKTVKLAAFYVSNLIHPAAIGIPRCTYMCG